MWGLPFKPGQLQGNQANAPFPLGTGCCKVFVLFEAHSLKKSSVWVPGVVHVPGKGAASSSPPLCR